jgi:DNA polymerase-3 subunit alpha
VDCRAVNKTAIEALIKCGAFGSTNATRRGMLEVLEAAQGAGAKAQLDAEIGQGSIFDLAPVGGPSPFAAPAHPPIPTHEFDRNDLLAIEKESIGLFISDHPLKRVREALHAKSDCACAEVMDRKEGDLITAGGMITAARKMRARSGSMLMFATLDDLEGSVELMVFEKTLAVAEAALQVDEIVLVKGRVDHKEGGKVILLVQSVERFDPSEAEIEKARAQAVKAAEPPKPLRLVVDAVRLPATVIDDLKQIFEDFPGEHQVELEVHTSTGPRVLKFGDGYRVAARNASLKAELDRLLPAPQPVAHALAPA